MNSAQTLTSSRRSLPQPSLVPARLRHRTGRHRGQLPGAARSRRPSRERKNPLAPRPPHFPARRKRVIYMFQAGAPSHLELFDNKPELTKRDGQLPPAELLKGYRAAFINPNSALLGPEVQVRTTRPVRHGIERTAAAHGGDRRRHLPDPLDADRRGQSRAGADPDEHRFAAVRPAQLRLVDAVRPGQRVRGSARASSC